MAGWREARAVIGAERVTLGPQATAQWLRAPEHLAMVLARYRAAAALIGTAASVLEVGCGEGIGARILASGRSYVGMDPDRQAGRVFEQQTEYDLSETTMEGYQGDLRPEAIVALDVIEHVEDGPAFVAAIARHLTPPGICVIGTPSARFDHLASPASRASHVMTYTHDHLSELMRRHFGLVQSFGMQDTALHLGHPEARHYLLMCGVGPRCVT